MKRNLIREVSSFQGLNYMLELCLGKEKVSLLLERCPHFRGFLKERFHCIYRGTSDKGPSEIGATSPQRTLVVAPC